MTIEETPGYQMVAKFYGDRRAERSGVLLINHINEGIEILRRCEANAQVMEAYAVHPLFQSDVDLKANFFQAIHLDPLVVLYAIEYRQIANDFLSDQVEIGPDDMMRETIYPKKPIRLSPIAPVNLMLVADKVQNRKDFNLYHKLTHHRRRELDFYFKFWLKRLDVSEERYEELIKDL